MSQINYIVQSAVGDLPSFPYHKSLSAVWRQKWRPQAIKGIYPFLDGKVEDFDKVFEQLIKDSKDDHNVFYNPDSYAAPFFPVAEDLATQAKAAETSGDHDKAKELYLRAAAVYRIARFPINRSPGSEKAWELGQAAYLAGSQYPSPPVHKVFIEYAHALESAGEKPGASIPAYLRIPSGERPKNGWPALLYICGLDGYRTDQNGPISAHVQHGFAVLAVDIPGTWDCPAARNDPENPDRLWTSVLDWLHKSDVATMYGLDSTKIVVRGVSTGGYYAQRIAHTHANHLLAVVAHGGGCHYMFDEKRIRAQNDMEYPFALADAMSYKFGYGGDIDAYAAGAQAKFSLLDNRIVDMPCTRLLLINGMDDRIFPIEDTILPTKHGRVKDARFIEGKSHMASPLADQIIFQWIDEIMAASK